jgi:hypothetical protein
MSNPVIANLVFILLAFGAPFMGVTLFGIALNLAQIARALDRAYPKEKPDAD